MANQILLRAVVLAALFANTAGRPKLLPCGYAIGKGKEIMGGTIVEISDPARLRTDKGQVLGECRAHFYATRNWKSHLARNLA
jgi:hypothetical protein